MRVIRLIGLVSLGGLLVLAPPATASGSPPRGSATQEGCTYCYLGSSGGLSLAASMESHQQGASSGTSVASAGDMNGDGPDDVIVGAHGQAQEAWSSSVPEAALRLG